MTPHDKFKENSLMVKSESAFIVNKDDLKIANRLDGISGIMRIRNEELTIRAAIESYLPALDELILVYNDCQDKSPEICQYYAQKYPHKVKAVHYKPFVVPWRSPEYKQREISDDSEESAANYSNFALCQTSRKIAIKVDAHLIALPDVFTKICQQVRQKMPKNELWYGKILIFTPLSADHSERKISMNKDAGKSWGNTDNPFFYVSQSTWFYYDCNAGKEGLEVMGKEGLALSKNVGVFALHIKALKHILAARESYPYQDFRNLDIVINTALEFNQQNGILSLKFMRLWLFGFFQLSGLPFKIEPYIEGVLKKYGFEFECYRSTYKDDIKQIILHRKVIWHSLKYYIWNSLKYYKKNRD